MLTHQEEKSSLEEYFGEVIYTYSRKQAIDDGVLVDLSSLFPKDTRIYRCPVACTSSVWGFIEKACKGNEGEPGAWVWDLCWMSVKAKCKVFSPSEHLFRCIIGRKTHTLKARCGPGDDMEPAVTIMLQNED